MRIVALLLLLLAACDPINKITVAFSVPPASQADVYWVRDYEGRTYADSAAVFHGDAPTGSLTFTRTECCGLAYAYRHHELRYIACVQTGDRAEIVCGHPDEPVAARKPFGERCDALRSHMSSRRIDFAACTISAPEEAPETAPSRTTP